MYCGTGGAALNILDLETGERRESRLKDIADIAKLVDALDNIHFSSSQRQAGAGTVSEETGREDF